MILGNDVSYWQGKIDFNKMKAAGSRFVYIRVGLGYIKDKNYEANKQAVKESGLPWGHYYVPTATTTLGNMLKAYRDMVGNDWGTLPPALDVETNGLGLGMFIEWLNSTEPLWLNGLPDDASEIRKKLTFYTRGLFFDQYSDTKGYKKELGTRTNLWVAHYTYDPLKNPIIPKNAWASYLIHQYSADENSLGVQYGVTSKSIDMNYFNGDEKYFADWVGEAPINEGGEPPVPNVGEKIRIKVAQLWGRTAPVLSPQTARYITRNGEIYEKYGSPEKDLTSGVWYQPIKIPEQKVYVSTNYIEEV